jgi:hypothetical protein
MYSLALIHRGRMRAAENSYLFKLVNQDGGRPKGVAGRPQHEAFGLFSSNQSPPIY